jgi:hypothetical protein
MQAHYVNGLGAPALDAGLEAPLPARGGMA